MQLNSSYCWQCCNPKDPILIQSPENKKKRKHSRVITLKEGATSPPANHVLSLVLQMFSLVPSGALIRAALRTAETGGSSPLSHDPRSHRLDLCEGTSAGGGDYQAQLPQETETISQPFPGWVRTFS